jgi:maltose phosphorylase
MTKTATRYLEVDPWEIEERGFHRQYGRVSESIFSLGNEFMGVRGYFEEGYSGETMVGSYFNGIFERFFIEHPFAHRGIASQEQKMLNSVDWLYTRITLDGEKLDLASSKFSQFIRKLDMRIGVLSRAFVWKTKKGKELKVCFERFLSMDNAQIGCQRVSFKPLNFSGTVQVESGLDCTLMHHNTSSFKSKPIESLWCVGKCGSHDGIMAIAAQTPTSRHKVFSGFKLVCPEARGFKEHTADKFISRSFSLALRKGVASGFDKIVFNTTEKNPKIDMERFWTKGLKQSQILSRLSYDSAQSQHQAYWARVWQNLDITIEGDNLNQQGIRFCIFNLHQTYHGVDASLNVPAKGLSGDGYDGKTWWDTETYCLPFYMFNNPKAARNLLEYRYKTLEHACLRSGEVDGCVGARYPMSTIDGTETCYIWQHGDLEIHVSAAVAYGIWHYDKVVGDKQFLYSKGIEILIEVCRYYASRGQFSQSTGEFGFWNVMGADEFHMMVNNNAYTNVMAKKVFEFTLSVIKEMAAKAPASLKAASAKRYLKQTELVDWAAKARKMRTNFDQKVGLYEQHDGFFDSPHLDCSRIRPEEYPIYSHWPYLKIFRWDMLKQPDALLLLFFFSSEYSEKCKRSNYDYYEPRCCHESSLSPAIHSILAAELGKYDEAYKFFKHATRLDLDDYNRNAWAGLHITSMAGAWMNIVQGFGGLRTDSKLLSFAPSLPGKWKSFSFKIMYREAILKVMVDRQKVCFQTSEKASIPIMVFGKKYVVKQGKLEIPMLAKRFLK